MSNKLFESTGDAYLDLVHPGNDHSIYAINFVGLIDLARVTDPKMIAALCTGDSWRERLVGFLMEVSVSLSTGHIVASLQDPRGMSIVPAAAALCVCGREYFDNLELDKLDRSAFDHELGWALDKLSFHLEIQQLNPGGIGPNYGQIFEDHVSLYKWAVTV